MTTGTKSVLFGVHCFFIHPWFVLWAYWRLYGFTLDPRIIVACIVHDLGYIGKEQMDDEKGQTHPILGAKIMRFLFDYNGSERWYHFCLLHSRWYSKRIERPYSRLCVADKYAIVLTPGWLYDILVNLTGEIHQYMDNALSINLEKAEVNLKAAKFIDTLDRIIDQTNVSGLRRMKHGALTLDSVLWYRGLQQYMLAWVWKVHHDGERDADVLYQRHQKLLDYYLWREGESFPLSSSTDVSRRK